jgi:hypothetical protein
VTSLFDLTSKLRAAGLYEAADGLQHAVYALDPNGDFVGSLTHLNAVLAVCQRVYRDTLDAPLVSPAVVPAIRPPEPVRLHHRVPGQPEPPEAA